jgi:tRNA threonylcarbamoyladenosine biosynthesis protein TsaE
MEKSSPLLYHLTSLEETKTLSKICVAFLTKSPLPILLEGDLGMGKSTFVRYCLNQWGHDVVPSPTYTLYQVYDIPKNKQVWHYDLYRIENEGELENLDLEEALWSCITFIEWPDRLAHYTPDRYLKVHFFFDNNKRSAMITMSGTLTDQDMFNKHMRPLISETN